MALSGRPGRFYLYGTLGYAKFGQDRFRGIELEVTLGWKWEAVQRGVLEVGIIENLISFDNSPDFGIHVGFSRRF